MIFIFLLALILFGPKKLPEIGREIGKFMAEFKRASNDFTFQLQSEIEKVETDVAPASQIGAQQTSSFAQTLLPPAVKSAITEIDSAHERLMQTARMAFDAQNFSLRPPQAPPLAAAVESAPELPLADIGAQSNAETIAQPNPQPNAQLTSETGAPALPASPVATAPREASPVEAVTDQPTPDSAAARSGSATQSS